MIKYKQLAEAILLENSNFRGEYWIQDGYVQFADADVGDVGHEGIVIENAAGQVLSELGIETFGDHVYIQDHDEDIFEAMQDGLTEEQMERYRNGEEVKVMIEYGKTVLNNPKFENLVLAAFDKIDVRRFAMREWGWKAIRGDNVDTWNLTSEDLKKISSGLGEAYDSEITQYEQNNKSVDENGFAGPYFNIEVYSVGDYYSDVPFSLIESKNVASLRPYKTINKGERITETGELIGKIDIKKPDNTKDPELQVKLDALSSKYKDRLNTYAIAYNEYIDLDKILAKKDAPIGTGSSYMKELCALADEHNKIIVLQTAPRGYGKADKGSDYFSKYKSTSSGERLKQFYSRFGFVSNYSKRDYRPDLRGNMHRYPQNKKI